MIGKTTLQMQLRATYIALSWNFLQVWGIFDLQDYPIHDLAGDMWRMLGDPLRPRITGHV